MLVELYGRPIKYNRGGAFDLILLALNLLISFTGTRLKFLYHMRTLLMVLFWLASGYMVYRILVEAAGNLATLLPMLIPLALSVNEEFSQPAGDQFVVEAGMHVLL